MPHGSAKSSTGGTKPGEREPIDFLATGFKVTTNCAFSVKILENFKLRSDKLAGGCAHAPLSVHPPLFIPPSRLVGRCRARRTSACVRGGSLPAFVPAPHGAPGARRGRTGGAECAGLLTAAGALQKSRRTKRALRISRARCCG